MKIKKDMRENIALYQEKIGVSIDMLTSTLSRLVNPIATDVKVVSRIKDPETLRKKMLRKNTRDIFSIHDIYGIRLIVRSIDDAYLIFEKIQKEFHMYLANDFIKNPLALHDPGFEGKSFRCLRIVAYKNDAPFEIQITTDAFHEINEAHHKIYHKKLYCCQGETHDKRS